MTKDTLIKWILGTALTISLLAWGWLFNETYDHAKKIVEIGRLQLNQQALLQVTADMNNKLDTLIFYRALDERSGP